MNLHQQEFALEPGEEVILSVRKHWFLFLAELLPYAIMAVMPFALPNLLSVASPLAPFAALFDYSSPVMRAVLGIWLLITWTAAWSAFTKYFLNAWILTTQRLVDIKQHRFFSREVSSLFLNRVQDVTTDVTGIIPSLLGIGNINVQSAGATERFYIRGIPEPERMRDLILKYVPEEDSKSTAV